MRWCRCLSLHLLSRGAILGRLRPGFGLLAETQSDGQALLRGIGGPSWSPVTCSISVSTSIMQEGCDSPLGRCCA